MKTPPAFFENDDYALAVLKASKKSTMTQLSNRQFGNGDQSFLAAGGRQGVRDLVDAFYDEMELDQHPEVVAVRQMHSADLSISRDKLVTFLTAWLGGPREYNKKYGSISIPGFHAKFDINNARRDAWLRCMRAAIAKQPYSEDFAQYLITQLAVPANRVVQASAQFHQAQ